MGWPANTWPVARCFGGEGAVGRSRTGGAALMPDAPDRPEFDRTVLGIANGVWLAAVLWALIVGVVLWVF